MSGKSSVCECVPLCGNLNKWDTESSSVSISIRGFRDSLGTAVIPPSKVCKGSGHSDIKPQNAGTPSLADYMLSFISYYIISSSQAALQSQIQFSLGHRTQS